MKFIPFIILGLQLDDPMRLLNSSRYGMWILVGIMLLIMLVAGLIGFGFYRWGRHRRSHRHRHRHHASRDSSKAEESDDSEDGESHGKRRRRRRRREHRPRNPTLSETGGLPPMRGDGPPPGV